MRFNVDVNTAGMRVDRCINAIFSEMTNGIIQKYIRNKDILVNKRKTEANYRLVLGDFIEINEYITKNITKNDNKKVFSPSAQVIGQKILNDFCIFEHSDFVAINKPRNIACQGGNKVSLSINNGLDYLNNGKDYVDMYKLVHRIDKHTSGILLIAKNRAAAEKLTEAFAHRLIHKQYIAITQHKDNDIILHQSGVVNEIVDDKEAETKYSVLHTIMPYSVIEFKPITGRKHQIRQHTLALHGAIVGDEKYFPLIFEEEKPYKNMLLHAHKLTIDKQIFGEEITITAPIPDDISQFAKTVGLKF